LPPDYGKRNSHPSTYNLKPVLSNHEAVTRKDEKSNLHTVSTLTEDMECKPFLTYSQRLSTCEVRSVERMEDTWESHCKKHCS